MSLDSKQANTTSSSTQNQATTANSVTTPNVPDWLSSFYSDIGGKLQSVFDSGTNLASFQPEGSSPLQDVANTNATGLTGVGSGTISDAIQNIMNLTGRQAPTYSASTSGDPPPLAAAQYGATDAGSQGYNAALTGSQGYNPASASATGYGAALAGSQGYQASNAGSQGYQAANAGSQGYRAALTGAQGYQAPTASTYLATGQAQPTTDTYGSSSLLSNLQSYLSPYTSAVVDPTLAAYDKQSGKDQASLDAQAGLNSGAFGSSGYNLQKGELTADQNLGRAQTQGTLLNNAFNAATTLSNQDADRSQSAAAANAGATNSANQFYSQLSQLLNLQNASSANAGSQFNAGQQATAGQFNAGAQNTAGLANQASQNAASQFGAGAANTAGLSNQAAQNTASQFGAGAANAAALQNANNQSTASQFGAAAGNTASLANQGALNAAGEFGAGALNTASLANQGAYNTAGQFGASAANTAGLANQGALNTAGQFGAGAANTAGLQNAQLGTSASAANAASQNEIAQFLAGLGVQNQQFNAGAQNTASQANQQAQLATNAQGLQNALGLGSLGQTQNSTAAADTALQGALGQTQYTEQTTAQQFYLNLLQQLLGSAANIPTAALSGQTTSATGTGSVSANGTSSTTSNPGFIGTLTDLLSLGQKVGAAAGG